MSSRLLKITSIRFLINFLSTALIEKFGRFIEIGKRGLLEAAVTTPMMAVFEEELHKTIYNKAAAYLFYMITKNHAFLGGNKRTAAATAF